MEMQEKSSREKWMDAWMDGWMGGWMDDWMGGWLDGRRREIVNGKEKDKDNQAKRGKQGGREARVRPGEGQLQSEWPRGPN